MAEEKKDNKDMGQEDNQPKQELEGNSEGEKDHTVPYGKYKAEVERWKSQAEELQGENTSLNKQLKEMQENPSVPDDVKKQLEELQNKLTQSETARKQGQIKGALEIALTKAGCLDTDLMLKGLDMNNVELTDDGLKGIDIDALKKDKPYLFTQPSKSNSALDGQNGSSDAVMDKVENEFKS